MLGHQKREFFEKWRKKVGEKEASKGANRGTIVHELVEEYLDNKPPTFPGPKYKFLFLQMKSELDKLETIVCQEVALYSDAWKIGGRLDCIAEINGKLWIVDFKTSKSKKKKEWIEDYFLQMSAYAKMWYEHTGMIIPRGRIIMTTDDGGCHVYDVSLMDYAAKFLLRRKEYKEEVGV